MKLVFEGSMQEVLREMADVLVALEGTTVTQTTTTVEADTSTKHKAQAKAPGPEVEEPKAPPAKKAAKTKQVAAPPKPAPEPDVDLDMGPEIDEAPAPPAELTPAELVAIRQQTVTELQSAYANGKQKEVHALLQKYGGGAKSFRELSVQQFVPIRAAIDNGALG